MTSSIQSATDVALSALLAQESRVSADAARIANPGGADAAPFASVGAGPGLTGTQPTVASPLVGGEGDLTAQIVDLISARNSYAANVDTLKVADQTTKQAIDLLA